jgi:predicted alpha-1,6-mannanase (GH76 family)
MMSRDTSSCATIEVRMIGRFGVSGPLGAMSMALMSAVFGCGVETEPSNPSHRAGTVAAGGAGGQAGSGRGGSGGVAGEPGTGPGGFGMADASDESPGGEASIDSGARADRSTPTDAMPPFDAAPRDGGITTPPPVLTGCDAATAHTRADRSIAQLMFGYWNGVGQYFDALEPSDGRSTGFWTFAQAFDAVLDGVERTGGRRYRGLVASLYAGQNAKTWRSDYYDDENWMALTLIHAYDLTGNRAYLDRAVDLYLDIIAAWDDTSAHPGGIWWNRTHTQKATASNAGPVITGVRLAARTGDVSHLTFARKIYEFWYTTMVDATYHVADHINADGTVARGRLTYNEGLMTGAALALLGATGEARFRTEAHGIAQVLATIGKATSAGRILADGTNTTCIGDCPQWKGIGYRYLAAALRDDPARTAYAPVLQASVEAAWTLARNPTTGYFANDWAGPSTTTAQIEAQSSTAMATNIFAMLCGAYVPPPSAGYEAEDAVLDHVALEETNAGFSGWGYVSAWTGNNQSVEFTVEAPAAGDYRADFAYAAAASEAARVLYVGGAMASPRLAFPSTGAWTSWGHATTTVHLSAGANSVKLAFETARSSANPLNLDRLTITP